MSPFRNLSRTRRFSVTTASPISHSKLFVGNLPFTVDSVQLAELFECAGNVEMVEVIYYKTTGRSRGFGFMTMSNAQEIEAAARQFNGYDLKGRSICVSVAEPRRPRLQF